MQTLGERILMLRRRHHMTQQALADKVDLNANTIARVERDTVHTLKGDTIAKIARVFQTSTDFLLGLTEEPALESKKQEEKVESEECPAAGELVAP